MHFSCLQAGSPSWSTATARQESQGFCSFSSSFLQLNLELLKENCSRALGGFRRTAPRQWPGCAWAWHRPPAGTGSPCRIRRPRALPLLCPREWHALANKCHLLLKAPPGSGRAAPVMNKRFAVAPLLGRRHQAGTAGSKAVRHARKNQPDTLWGTQALFTAAPGRRSPHGTCKTPRVKGRLLMRCTPAAPQGGRSRGAQK